MKFIRIYKDFFNDLPSNTIYLTPDEFRLYLVIEQQQRILGECYYINLSMTLLLMRKNEHQRSKRELEIDIQSLYNKDIYSLIEKKGQNYILERGNTIRDRKFEKMPLSEVKNVIAQTRNKNSLIYLYTLIWIKEKKDLGVIISQDSLADIMGVSRRSMVRYLSELEERQLISHNRTNKYQNFKNYYRTHGYIEESVEPTLEEQHNQKIIRAFGK